MAPSYSFGSKTDLFVAAGAMTYSRADGDPYLVATTGAETLLSAGTSVSLEAGVMRLFEHDAGFGGTIDWLPMLGVGVHHAF